MSKRSDRYCLSGWGRNYHALSGRIGYISVAICVGVMAEASIFLPMTEAQPVLDSAGTGVSISGAADMFISSSTRNNIIKWVDFSIRTGDRVVFDNNNYLNYVTGKARSEIMGTVSGGGQIYIVNPNGILIGETARIDVGSLYLSTRNLPLEKLDDFGDAASLLFSNGSSLKGDVINMGHLNANSITVEGRNITFRNVEDVTGNLVEHGVVIGTVPNDAVTLLALGDGEEGGEIHLGSETGNSSGYVVKAGRKFDYKLVHDVAGLDDMRNNLSGNYMLDGNISCAHLEPIGKDISNPFTGRFDGLNYKLSNLKIDYTFFNQEAGLFGANRGRIENLEIDGFELVNLTNYVTAKAGAVAGWNGDDGKIINVRVTGKIEHTVKENKTAFDIIDYFGAIAGRNDGLIENSCNAADISITRIRAAGGGIAGSNYGSIRRVFNSGNITSGSDSTNYIGGIVGQNLIKLGKPGKIENAYNTGAVNNQNAGYGYAGGIAGQNEGNINRTYNTGEVTGSRNRGGIAGFSDMKLVTNSYHTLTDSAGDKSASGTRTTADRLAQEAGLDSWDLLPGENKNSSGETGEDKPDHVPSPSPDPSPDPAPSAPPQSENEVPADEKHDGPVLSGQDHAAVHEHKSGVDAANDKKDPADNLSQGQEQPTKALEEDSAVLEQEDDAAAMIFEAMKEADLIICTEESANEKERRRKRGAEEAEV